MLKRWIPRPLLRVYFILYPMLGALRFGFPSRKLTVIGVTGTDGKSSTVIFLASILRSAGYKVGHYSSVSSNDGKRDQINSSKMTMPGRFVLQKFLRKLVSNGCTHAVLEVTSEGIKQERHRAIDFSVAVCTNITREHIESHGGFGAYRGAKAKLFQRAKTLVVNADDDYCRGFLAFPAEQKYSFSQHQKNSDLRGAVVSLDMDETVLKLTLAGKTSRVRVPLGGPFVADNVLAAATAAHALGVEFAVIVEALEQLAPVPGRFEIVSREPLVIVDYAHTPAAVEKLLSFVRAHWTGKIVHVFGAAGGGRDKWKRPLLAKLSEKYTDMSILSEENSFEEPTEEIMADIKKGFVDSSRVLVIPNRTKAVRKALSIADHSTLVVCTAKGSETVIAGPYGRKTPYSERKTVLCELDKLSRAS